MLIHVRTRVAILLLAAALTACSDDGVRPPTGYTRALAEFPLAQGNTWNYDLTFDATYTREDGSDARPPEHFTATGTRAITGTDSVSGREYLVETYTAVADGGDPAIQWRRYRLDADTLFQADLSPGVPPGEVPPDFETGELVRLRFPLRVGDRWQLRPGSDHVMVLVEARETLSLAIGKTPAWRLRVVSATDGPDDFIYIWFGAEGLLRREDHAEFDATNGLTGEVIHITLHEVQELTDVSLQEEPWRVTLRPGK
jgi:hypothetical protein